MMRAQIPDAEDAIGPVTSVRLLVRNSASGGEAGRAPIMRAHTIDCVSKFGACIGKPAKASAG